MHFSFHLEGGSALFERMAIGNTTVFTHGIVAVVVQHTMPLSQFLRGCDDREAGPKFTSLSEVGAWLETLPDVGGR